MTKILLVRHGHVEGIHPERFRGRQDVPLSELGLRQARATGEYVAAHYRPSFIYGSPLQRCVQTAAEIAHHCNTSAEALDELNDLDYGEWQWRTHEDVGTHWPQLLALWRESPHQMRFPQGESLQDLAARVAEGARLILQRHPNKTVVLVGHDSSLRVLLLQWLDMPVSAYWRLAQEPCGLSEVEVSGPDAKVLRLNETQHVPSPRS